MSRIASIAKEVRYAPGKVVIGPETTLDALYVILEGAVSITRDGIELHVAHQNEVLGAWALFDPEPMSVTAKTIEDTRVLSIGRDDFYDLLVRQHRDHSLDLRHARKTIPSVGGA